MLRLYSFINKVHKSSNMREAKGQGGEGGTRVLLESDQSPISCGLECTRWENTNMHFFFFFGYQMMSITEVCTKILADKKPIFFFQVMLETVLHWRESNHER